MNNTISETGIARQWLNQFEKNERKTARLLIESIIVVSESEFISNLKAILEEFQNKYAKGKIALFSTRERENNPYWLTDGSIKRVNPYSSIGSEGFISCFIRDLSRENKNFLDHPNINKMRKEKCRHIFCVDDIIGSGKRSADFLSWLYMDKTIKSWCSLHYIDLNVCTYAATSSGEKKIRNIKYVNEILLVQAIERGRSFWSEEERDKIIKLCNKYGEYTSRSNMSEGYLNAFTLIVFPHKCPNTDPAILWSSHKGTWNALFAVRPNFNLNDIFEQSKQKISLLLKLIGHSSFLDSLLYLSLSDEGRIMLAFLSKLSIKKYRPTIFSEMYNLPLPKVNKLITKMQYLNWINSEFCLTNAGKKVLKSAKKKKIVHGDIAENEGFYYPSTLRAPS